MNVESVAMGATTRVPHGTTNAVVVGSDPALLVDPAGVTPALENALAGRALEHVAVTHTHPDHVGGVATVAERTGATVWARRGYVERFREATGVEPDGTLREGTAIAVDGGAVRAVATPGHAPDHLAFRVGEVVIGGDLAVADGSVVVGAPDGDVRAYLTSLRRLHAVDPERVLPGHGPAIEDPRGAIERLIAHRLERERRVRTAVRGGARTVEGILAAAYDKDLSGVRDLAAATVRAHLEKLAVEGDLRWDGERAEPA